MDGCEYQSLQFACAQILVQVRIVHRIWTRSQLLLHEQLGFQLFPCHPLRPYRAHSKQVIACSSEVGKNMIHNI